MKILVTGGCGYIGAHTIVDLLQNGHQVISIDDNSKSDTRLLAGIEKIIGIPIKNYCVNLCDMEATKKIFEIENFDGIIHFAAYKSVAESVKEPLAYYNNNINSLLNILNLVAAFKIKHFVFSSSCSVYGNATVLPVTEDTPLCKPQSAYAATKQMCEQIIIDFCKIAECNAIMLRYFNPTGAHKSGHIGEITIGPPTYLVPAITQTACGLLPKMYVHGTDYDTIDGSCVRDYIHVSDIAHAHTLALNYKNKFSEKNNPEIFNLGSGKGISVLQAIASFEKVSAIKLNYELGPRRAGDVIAVYAYNKKATTELNWECQYTLDEMMLSAWKWQLQLLEKENEL
jgi:UDP-glucose 4-epimerase